MTPREQWCLHSISFENWRKLTRQASAACTNASTHASTQNANIRHPPFRRPHEGTDNSERAGDQENANGISKKHWKATGNNSKSADGTGQSGQSASAEHSVVQPSNQATAAAARNQ